MEQVINHHLLHMARQDNALVKVNAELIHVEKEKDSLSVELSGRKQELEATKQLLESQRAEERKLRKILSEASAEGARQKKELEWVRLAPSYLCTLVHCVTSERVMYTTVIMYVGHQ